MNGWLKTKVLTKQQRLLYLRNHPAVAVRIFDLTQQAIWSHILMGNNHPLGKIVDYWRRIEVTIHQKMLFCFVLKSFITLSFHYKIVSDAGYSSHALNDMCAKR
jgi:hypothetical protein